MPHWIIAAILIALVVLVVLILFFGFEAVVAGVGSICDAAVDGFDY